MITFTHALNELKKFLVYDRERPSTNVIFHDKENGYLVVCNRFAICRVPLRLIIDIPLDLPKFFKLKGSRLYEVRNLEYADYMPLFADSQLLPGPTYTFTLPPTNRPEFKAHLTSVLYSIYDHGILLNITAMEQLPLPRNFQHTFRLQKHYKGARVFSAYFDMVFTTISPDINYLVTYVPNEGGSDGTI